MNIFIGCLNCAAEFLTLDQPRTNQSIAMVQTITMQSLTMSQPAVVDHGAGFCYPFQCVDKTLDLMYKYHQVKVICKCCSKTFAFDTESKSWVQRARCYVLHCRFCHERQKHTESEMEGLFFIRYCHSLFPRTVTSHACIFFYFIVPRGYLHL